MKTAFIALYSFLASSVTVFSQHMSRMADQDECELYTICVNVSDMIDKTNSHYFLFMGKGPIIVKPTGDNFEHEKVMGRLIPRQFSDSRRVNDFMLLFNLESDAYEMLKRFDNADFTMQLNLKEKLSDGTFEEIPLRPFPFTLKPNSFSKISEKVILHEASIPIAYPENLTIPAISLDIQDKLAGLQFYYDFDTSTNTKDDSLNWRFKEVYAPCSHQDSAYVRAIKYLDELVLNRSASISLSIEQIDDLMRLYLFTKEYLEPGSFYKEEATKLAAAVTVMEFEKAYLINDSLSTLLRISRNSLQQYEKTMERLRSCHVRSKVMLLRQGVLLHSDHDENIWLYREGYDQENGRYGRASFGAFAVPARLRLNSSARFSNDFTIGASFHQPWPKNPGLETVFGLGLSAITVDSINSQKGLKMAAFTQVLGIAYSPMGNHFQLGLFFGLDIGRFPESQTIPWIAIGAAYRLRKPVIIPKRPVEGKFDPMLRG